MEGLTNSLVCGTRGLECGTGGLAYGRSCLACGTGAFGGSFERAFAAGPKGMFLMGKLLVKASGAVQAPRVVSLLQQKVWNVLLANAYDDLSTKKKFEISMSELVGGVGFVSNNREYVKKAIRGLCKKVRFNLFEKDKRKWGSYKLLLSVDIKRGKCVYKYSPKLQALLYEPTEFALIDLEIQKKFKSRYSLFLYELLVDYRAYGGPPQISIKKFRQYMGIKESSYTNFNQLNYQVIQKAIKEVNKVSDIFAEVLFERAPNGLETLLFVVADVEKL